MAPTDKAKELIEKFSSIEDEGKTLSGFMDEYLGKQCALVAVDEILKSKPEDFHKYDEPDELLSWPDKTHVDANKYWQQVKEAIQNFK